MPLDVLVRQKGVDDSAQIVITRYISRNQRKRVKVFRNEKLVTSLHLHRAVKAEIEAFNFGMEVSHFKKAACPIRIIILQVTINGGDISADNELQIFKASLVIYVY